MTLLAISPGTRLVGIALFRDAELVDWRTKGYSKPWSCEKCQKILADIEEKIITAGITILAVKIPADPYCPSPLREVIAGITEITKKYTLPLHTYTICGLKKTGIFNRIDLMNEIVLKSPELLQELGREMRNKNPYYYIKLFEAVAAGRLCCETMCEK